MRSSLRPALRSSAAPRALPLRVPQQRSAGSFAKLKPPPPGAEPKPRFRYAGLNPTTSFAVTFFSIFGSFTLGYFINQVLDSNNINPFGPGPKKASQLAPLDVDPASQETGSGTYRPMHGSKKAYEAAINALRQEFPEDNVSTDESDLREHGISEWSYHEAHPPSCVVWAES